MKSQIKNLINNNEIYVNQIETNFNNELDKNNKNNDENI